MASEATIQLNYQQAINQAKSLENLASELRTLANNNMESTISELSGNWTGDNARAFIEKAEKAQNDLLKNARALTDAARVIRESAENIRKAELLAKRIAEMMDDIV